VVTFHCTRCHRKADAHERCMSAGPAGRRYAGLRARKHMRMCEGAAAAARDDELAAAVRKAVTGSAPVSATGLYAAYCQTATLHPDEYGHPSSCAEVRQARIHTAAHQR
jgi:hypothetical protein